MYSIKPYTNMIVLIIFVTATLSMPDADLDDDGFPKKFQNELYACIGCAELIPGKRNQQKQYEFSIKEDDDREIYWTGSQWTCYKPQNGIHWPPACERDDLFQCKWQRWIIDVNGIDKVYQYWTQWGVPVSHAGYNRTYPPQTTPTDGSFVLYYEGEWTEFGSPPDGGAHVHTTLYWNGDRCTDTNIFRCGFVTADQCRSLGGESPGGEFYNEYYNRAQHYDNYGLYFMALVLLIIVLIVIVLILVCKLGKKPSKLNKQGYTVTSDENELFNT